jgi:hypothetical protein
MDRKIVPPPSFPAITGGLHLHWMHKPYSHNDLMAGPAEFLIQEAFLRGDVREVCHPDFVYLRGPEIPLHEVLGHLIDLPKER